MSKTRDFKKLVRQRMAETGESYTAARAVLLKKAVKLQQGQAPSSEFAPAALPSASDVSRLATDGPSTVDLGRFARDEMLSVGLRDELKKLRGDGLRDELKKLRGDGLRDELKKLSGVGLRDELKKLRGDGLRDP